MQRVNFCSFRFSLSLAVLFATVGTAMNAAAVDAAPKDTQDKRVLRMEFPGHSVSLSLKELKARLKSVTVTLDDPVYKKKKSYDGFLLTDVLSLGGWNAQSGGDEIVFKAQDGYAPSTPLTQLGRHRAYLVFQEHGRADFEKLAQGKTVISPAPYYVVWEEGAKLAEEVPWPYQLVQVEIVDFRRKYEKLYPRDAQPGSSVMKGFLTFKNQCLRCHSINLQGGDLGPELNIPQNVTEYWSKATLKRFVRDVSSFRYRSKMPSFAHLKESEIDELIDYLEAMKAAKIQPAQ